MSCAPESLSSYLDDRLGDRARALVHAHVQGCSACAAELGLLARAAQLLGSEGPARAPEGLAAALTSAALAADATATATDDAAAATDNASDTPSFAERWLGIAWPAAATAAVVAAVLLALAARGAAPGTQQPQSADPLAEITTASVEVVDYAAALLAMEGN